MTAVFQRPRGAAPVTHALVVGCGHFPHLPGAPTHDRRACPDSARRVVEFLVLQRNEMRTPLATVECLITEFDGSAGQVPQTDAAFDPRPDTAVEKANASTLEQAGLRWTQACLPGDHLFFYGCSHGIAERDGSAFLLLEDIHANPNRKWANALNVRALATELPAITKAGACWVFMDACQELLADVVNQVDGLSGWKLVEANVMELAATQVRTAGLAAAPFGGTAEAPEAGGVANFTKALLLGLEQCCVERTSAGWSVSAKEILSGIPRVAEVAFGKIVETEQLGGLPEEFFRDVANPEIPVLVKAEPSTLLSHAANPRVTAAGGAAVPTDPPNSEWRFRVPAAGDYVVTLDPPPGEIRQEFFAKPPAVTVEVP